MIRNRDLMATPPYYISAYGIWLKLGNQGTEQDFIDSLQGADGEKTLIQYNGATGNLEWKHENGESWAVLLSFTDIISQGEADVIAACLTHANTAQLHSETAAGYAEDAQGYASAASASKTAAENSAASAANHANNASASETAAAGSVAAAAGSASTAASKANEAAASATTAQNSVSAAAAQASAAAGSAASAGNSADAASGSAASASGYASAASTSAGEAAASAAAAQNSVSAAAAQASAAADRAARAEGEADKSTSQATKSESYAVGGTGTRPGEDEDNSKHYSEVAQTAARTAADRAAEAAQHDILTQTGLTVEQQITARTNINAAPVAGSYELIETITLTENVASIVRTQEPDGTPYSFKRLKLMVHTTAATASSNSVVSAFCGETLLTSLGMSGLLNTSDRYSVLEFYDDNNIWSAGATSAAAGLWANIWNVLPTFDPKLRQVYTEINKIQFKSSTASVLIPAGTVISIYGVRA